MQAAKAIIRKPAPAFAGQAWWNNKFQEIKLEQFKGKCSDLPLSFLF